MEPTQRTSVVRHVCLAAIGALVAATRVQALTPDSPDVRAAVDRACTYLADIEDLNSPGPLAITGLVFLKAGRPDHPRVQQAFVRINEVLQFQKVGVDIYSASLMLIFLTELPDERQKKSAKSIEKLIAHFCEVQKPHGGWGYTHLETGDTSMTQHVVLGLWSADAAGYDTPRDCWERAANWLMRTQDPDGAHGYQGNDPGNFTPVEQELTTLSMCAAGAGSLFVCADFFGLLNTGLEDDNGDSVLRKVKKPVQRRQGEESTEVDGAMLLERMAKANRYIDANITDSPVDFVFYYLYALERYRTFRDFTRGRLDDESDWYDDGAAFLLKAQEVDGHWASTKRGCGDVCDTCFASLFLLRSMYKKLRGLNRLGSGLLVGGRGLPAGEGDLQMRKGTVKRKPLSGPAEELLGIVGNPYDPEFQAAIDGLEEQSLAGDDDHLNDIQKRLRDLLSHDKSPQQRAAALKLLARTHDLQQVPLLIEALNDRDESVFWAANDALRFISRKFDGATFSNDSTFEATRKRSLTFWRRWFDSLHLNDVTDE